MTLDKEILTVLDLATEDYYGLWEIDWAFRTDFPELNEAEALSRACDVVRKMVDDDQITLFRCSNSDEPAVPIANDEVESVLSQPKNWAPKLPSEEQIEKIGEEVFNEFKNAPQKDGGAGASGSGAAIKYNNNGTITRIFGTDDKEITVDVILSPKKK